MNNRSRSTLFLIEQLIVIAVFALCAAACVRILTDAYFTTNNSKDKSNALLVAESGAESFKASSGDLGMVARIMGGTSGDVGGSPAAIVYYDAQWKICASESSASFVLYLFGGAADYASLRSGDILVQRISGEELVSFSVLARS